MSCAEVFDDVLKNLARLQVGSLPSQTAKEFRGEIKSGLERAERRARERSLRYSPDHLKDCKFAIVALADEAAARNPLKLTGEWKDDKNRKLAQELCDGEVNAGKAFYERLKKWRGGTSPDAADVMEVYCLCLFLGYQGEKTIEKDRNEFIRDLYGEIRLVRGAPKLHVGADRLTGVAAGVRSRDWAQVFAFWSVLTCVFLLIAFKVFLWFSTNAVIEQTRQYVSQQP